MIKLAMWLQQQLLVGAQGSVFLVKDLKRVSSVCALWVHLLF